MQTTKFGFGTVYEHVLLVVLHAMNVISQF